MKSLFCLVFSLLFCINKCQELRIAGGKKAEIAQYPFFAQIVRKVVFGNMERLRQCGGTLIQPHLILTAAHCFPKDEEKRKYIVAMNFIKTYMGSLKRFNKHEPNNNLIENDVIEVFTHPYYDIIFPEGVDETSGIMELGIQNDVSIIKLRRQYRLSPILNLLPTYKPKILKCKKGIIIGMGSMGDKWSDQLMYARVKFLQHSELTDPSMYIPMNDTVFYVEAKYLHGHVMPGDSGGAALCDFEDGVVQRGVISTGHVNQTTGIQLDVYEDIFKHIDFINSVVEKELRRKRIQSVNIKELHKKSDASSVTPSIFSYVRNALNNYFELINLCYT